MSVFSMHCGVLLLHGDPPGLRLSVLGCILLEISLPSSNKRQNAAECNKPKETIAADIEKKKN